MNKGITNNKLKVKTKKTNQSVSITAICSISIRYTAAIAPILKKIHLCISFVKSILTHLKAN